MTLRADSFERPPLLFALQLRVELGGPLELGNVQGVRRRVIPITGGTFEGPLLSGEVLPGGADWQHVRSDGVAVLDARYTLRTNSGALISVMNRGYRHGAPDLAERMMAGKQVPQSEYYFMSTPLFETAAPDLQWMSRMIFAAQGERTSDSVLLTVWQVGVDVQTRAV